MASECASIGMKKCEDPEAALERFKAVMFSIEQFVAEHPSMIIGEGEFTCFFGPREQVIKTVSDGAQQI